MAAVTPQVFDSSGLKDIASAMPDVVGSTANAYKLKDMVDTSQMNTLKLAEAKKEITTREQTNEALRSLPLNATQEQRMQALEKIRQGPGGYEAAMQALRNFGVVDKEAADRANVEAQTKKHLAEASAKTFEAYQDKVAAFDGNFLPVWQKFNDLVGKGMPVAQASAAVQPDYQRAYVGAISATDAAGNLIYNDPGSKQKFQQLGPTFDPDKLGPEIMQSEKIRKQLEEAKKARDESQFKGAETNLAILRGKSLSSGGSEFGKADIRMMAEQYLAGDKSVFQNLGRGQQGTQAIRQLRMEVRQLAEERGMSGADIAVKMGEFEGFKAGERTLATSMVNIEQASTEAGKMIDVARTASAQVPRGSFMPWTSLVQKGQIMTNDPKLNAFAASTLAVVNTWARAINPKGVPTVADKEHAYDILNKAKNQEAYGAILDQFETEIRASLEAPADVKQAMHDRFVGKSTPKPPPAGGPSPVDKAGYDALPKGARYTMPGDPTVRVKQ